MRAVLLVGGFVVVLAALSASVRADSRDTPGDESVAPHLVVDCPAAYLEIWLVSDLISGDAQSASGWFLCRGNLFQPRVAGRRLGNKYAAFSGVDWGIRLQI